MRAVDTNVLVRLISQDDPRQVASALKFVETGAWVSVVALTEAVWVLSSTYEMGFFEIAEALENLINHESLILQDSDAVTAALALFRSRPALGFADCLILELARKAGHLPLGTFDRRLANIEGAQKIGAKS